jgi:glycosyltransferase involved in cell wall biosynthesis
MHASHGEVGYSLSILEYMSAGLTTLVPDRPSTAEAIVHDENGLLFRPGDVRHACDLLQRCLDEQVRGRLSGKAITTVALNYSLEKTNKELVRILDPLFS